MIRHCVFVKYRAVVDGDQRRSIAAALEALTPKIAGMRGVLSGQSVSPEGLGKGFDDGFIIDFEDAAARDAYLVHPDHQAAGGRIVAAAEDGVNGVFVFDFELPG